VIAETETVAAGEARHRPFRVAHRGIDLIERNGSLVLVLCAAALAFLSRLPSGLAGDSWSVLLSGREIAQHGLPVHDSLTVWGHGRAWVDQQWLAQLTMYSVQRLGGIRLVMLVHAALATGGFATACAMARRRGASALSVTWIGALGLFAFYPEAVTMRAQSFAYALFVAVLALLVQDGRRASTSVYLVVPLLALWANLHGSVVVGAALVSAYGLLGLRASWRVGHGRWPRALLLTLAPWGCVLASPYAASLPSYYRWILFDVHFERFITEWAPTTLTLATAPVYLLAIGGAWLFGSSRGNVLGLEALAFFATAILALQAERNLPWFGLAAVVVLPRLLDRVRTPAAEPRRANRILAGAALVGVATTVGAVAAKSNSWFLGKYPGGVADSAAATAGRGGRVFANESYADWLVWRHPELAGRIAFDTRFELLTTRQLVALRDFRTGTGDWLAAAAGYDVLVLSAKDEEWAIANLLQSGHISKVAEDGGIVVLRREPTQRAPGT
jgi:hypothetical protein